MDEIYELVKAGKLKMKIDSDRGYAIANSINPQVIVDLKSGKSMPNAENMLKILSAANMNVEEGIKAIQRQREAGFTTLPMMMGLSGFSAVTILAMSHLPYQAIGATFMNSASLYIM